MFSVSTVSLAEVFTVHTRFYIGVCSEKAPAVFP